MIEIWQDIPEFEGVYQISNLGRLKSFKRHSAGTILSNKNSKGDYLSVVLGNNGSRRSTRIHVLVAEAFIAKPDWAEEVNHIDGNRQNNRVDNLEWVTHKQNMDHAVDMYPQIHGGMNNYNRYARPKPIQQLTLDGELIAEYNNGTEASEKTGICQRNILQVAAKTEYKPGKIRRQAGGFIWRFKERYEHSCVGKREFRQLLLC